MTMIIDRIAMIIAIIGGLNWGSIGVFQFDIVAWICGGQSGVISRIVYILVGIVQSGVFPCYSVTMNHGKVFGKSTTTDK